MTNDLLFQAWLIANNFDQQAWLPGLLRALKARYEKSQEKIVVDGALGRKGHIVSMKSRRCHDECT